MKADKKLVYIAMLGAAAGAMQLAEGYIFAPVPIPGGKPGIANIAVIVALHFFGLPAAAAVSALKSALALAGSGSVTAFAYSLCGGAASAVVMALLKKHVKSVSYIGIGVAGAFLNNIVQTAVGALITQNAYVLSYIWVLGFVSVVTGIFTGISAKYIIKGLVKI